jgi:hypothetical protein
LELGKEIKSKKAVELLVYLDFLELFSELISKIRFENQSQEKQIIPPFKRLKKSLQKIHHLRLVEKTIKTKELSDEQKFESFKEYLASQKKQIHKESFELVVGSTLKSWEDFLEGIHRGSKGINPLMISTVIHQVVQEELEIISKEAKPPINVHTFRDLFETLKRIIMLENVLIHLGFNSIFIPQIHEEIQSLKNELKPWFSNHLTFQSLSHFLSQREEISKKYLDWGKELKEEKKIRSMEIERKSILLLSKIMS